ncbi:hypothetical protein REMIM1_CH01341 [Rhizobium etli bv. mimosae str. Mim1]|nr:hypothetical protein REMIM1_CH01341 [Rhizobium etli bv. mimosae str. Mim1]
MAPLEKVVAIESVANVDDSACTDRRGGEGRETARPGNWIATPIDFPAQFLELFQRPDVLS